VNTRDDFDLRLSDLLQEVAPPRVPEYLEEVRLGARRHRQRPAWSFPGRWLGVDVAVRPPAPFGWLAWALIVVALLALLAVAAIVGSPRRLPPPFGPAANGVIVYDDGAHILGTRPGSSARPLGSGQTIDTRPSASLDGRRIAFLREAGSATSVVVASIDGSEPHEIAVASSTDGLTVKSEPPAWSPDGTRIAITVIDSRNAQDHAEIWIVDAAVGGHSILLPAGLASVEQPAWSPDGDRIAFLGEPRGEPSSFLYVTRLDATGLLKISEQASNAEAGYFQLPRWSPDGRLIAVHHGDAGRLDRDILLLATDHLNESVVGTPSADEAQPAWSPDGGSLAFWRSVGGFNWRVVILDLATRTEQVVGPTSGNADSLSWSPDGSGIVVVTCPIQTSCRLLLVDVSDPRAPPTLLAEVPPKSYDVSSDQVYWSWQRLAP
jgi:Tol biopolymer transport system component